MDIIMAYIVCNTKCKIQHSNIDRLGYLIFFLYVNVYFIFTFIFTFILSTLVQKQDCVELCILCVSSFQDLPTKASQNLCVQITIIHKVSVIKAAYTVNWNNYVVYCRRDVLALQLPYTVCILSARCACSPTTLLLL